MDLVLRSKKKAHKISYSGQYCEPGVLIACRVFYFYLWKNAPGSTFLYLNRGECQLR